mmetsp:Transcript_26019/g.51031  ORF Transcript_26019/g.51031 Transcript_26019/m.51031 type:complete len:251 (-) Transcript_26019:1515-2267(-)
MQACPSRDLQLRKLSSLLYSEKTRNLCMALPLHPLPQQRHTETPPPLPPQWRRRQGPPSSPSPVCLEMAPPHLTSRVLPRSAAPCLCSLEADPQTQIRVQRGGPHGCSCPRVGLHTGRGCGSASTFAEICWSSPHAEPAFLPGGPAFVSAVPPALSSRLPGRRASSCGPGPPVSSSPAGRSVETPGLPSHVAFAPAWTSSARSPSPPSSGGPAPQQQTPPRSSSRSPVASAVCLSVCSSSRETDSLPLSP